MEGEQELPCIFDGFKESVLPTTTTTPSNSLGGWLLVSTLLEGVGDDGIDFFFFEI